MSEPAEVTVEGQSPDTESRIFDAALGVFAQKGRDGARMQDIADRAGINRALLHYYFRSKDQLYQACFSHLFEQFVQSYQAFLPTDGTFGDTLKAFIHNYIDYVASHLDMARLVLNENLSGGTLLGEHLQRAFATKGSPQQRMEQAILRAVEAGEIAPVDPRQLILTVISSCIFVFLMAPTVKMMNPAARDDFEGFIEARKAHVFQVIYHGLRLEGGGA
jgi:TetR/AcrR family transcriptional regulator